MFCFSNFVIVPSFFLRIPLSHLLSFIWILLKSFSVYLLGGPRHPLNCSSLSQLYPSLRITFPIQSCFISFRNAIFRYISAFCLLINSINLFSCQYFCNYLLKVAKLETVGIQYPNLLFTTDHILLVSSTAMVTDCFWLTSNPVIHPTCIQHLLFI
jgi:hypothetical protein